MTDDYRRVDCIQYDIVGISRDATKEQIIEACRLKQKKAVKQEDTKVMTVINVARGILTDDDKRQKYDAALDRLGIKDGENPGLVEVSGDNPGIAEYQSNLPMGAANQQEVQATAKQQIVTIGCAYKDDNFEISPKDFDELEVFIKQDNNLEPKSYEISYTKKSKQFKIKN